MSKAALLVVCLSLLQHGTFGKKAKCVMDGKNGEGNIAGVVLIEDKDNEVKFTYDLTNVNFSGTKGGFHVHEKGDLGNKCMNAGGHFNPHNKQHGGPNDEERHLGDLGNIEAKETKAEGTKTDSKVSLYGDNSILGKALVIHELEDDLGKGSSEESKTTGGAGKRLQCCIITESLAFRQTPLVYFMIIPIILSFLLK